MTSAPAIGFDYRPSGSIRRLLAVVAMLAVVAVAVCGAPPWLKLLLAAGTVVLAWIAARRWAHSPITGVGYGQDGWILFDQDRNELPARLLSHRVIGSSVLLRLRTDDRARTLLLAPDNSDADIRRRLRMRLAAQTSAAAIA